MVIISMYFSVVHENPCGEPITPGRCRGYFPRYGFDQSTGQCKSFIYGGCGGNSNNFETLEECKAACGKQNLREFKAFIALLTSSGVFWRFLCLFRIFKLRIEVSITTERQNYHIVCHSFSYLSSIMLILSLIQSLKIENFSHFI